MRNCIYHAGCPDGFGAAWAAWRAWGEEARYIPRGHDDTFDPRVYEGQTVAFVDISLPNELLRDLGEVADEVILLDHHLTARDDYQADPSVENHMLAHGHRVHFDLGHSGAVLAWNYFHPDEPAPDLLLYVEDQDLWSWKLPHSDEINAAISSYPRHFEEWNALATRPIESLAAEGEPLVRANRLEVERALASGHPVRIGTLRIEAVNARHPRAAIGHELAKRALYGSPWGAVYRMAGDRVDCSLYSIGDFDVASVAASHGGGGHRNAAGFSVPLSTWLADFA